MEDMDGSHTYIRIIRLFPLKMKMWSMGKNTMLYCTDIFVSVLQSVTCLKLPDIGENKVIM